MKYLKLFEELDLFDEDNWDEEEPINDKVYNTLKDIALSIGEIDEIGDDQFLQLHDDYAIGRVIYFNDEKSPFSLYDNDNHELGMNKVIEISKAEETINKNGSGEIDYSNIRLISVDDDGNFDKKKFRKYMIDNNDYINYSKSTCYEDGHDYEYYKFGKCARCGEEMP